MKRILLIILSLLFTISNSHALNILGIFPYQGKSHFLIFKVHLMELAKRGHNVTVISHFPEDSPPKNYKDISLAGTIKIFLGDMPIDTSYLALANTVKFLLTSGTENCEVMLANKEVQELVKSKTKFDVVLMEQFTSDCGLGIAYKLGAPVVATGSSVMMPWHYQRLGVPYNPSYVPFHFTEGGTKPTLFQRTERLILDTVCRYLYYFVTQKADQNTLAKYFDDIPPLEDLAREIKFLLLYHNFVLTGSRLFPANVIEVGGYHVTQAKPLEGDLKKFVEEAKDGIIYISFGSVVKSSTMPKEKLDAILEALSEFPQRIIWKWEDSSQLPDKDKNYSKDWLPQLDILGDSKIVAFISHAGLGGTTEALHYGVPMVAIPILGEQPSNAAAIEESGLGVQVLYRHLNKENLVSALKKVTSPEFRKNVQKLSEAWHDRPMSPLDTAVFWTEFAAKHPNITYRTAAADVPAYQYLNLDIACVFLLMFLPVIVAIKMVTSKPKCKKAKRE